MLRRQKTRHNTDRTRRVVDTAEKPFIGDIIRLETFAGAALPANHVESNKVGDYLLCGVLELPLRFVLLSWLCILYCCLSFPTVLMSELYLATVLYVDMLLQ